MSTRSTQAQSAAPAAPAIAPHTNPPLIPPQHTVPELPRQAADGHVRPAPADPVAEEEAGGAR
ncbi:hypothetical protein [Streptomyces luteireticuli]|uniref:hypothetical protein n=1 Tax=Streptomyces luteireticuli TaxID=173858 RepID=UPI0035565C74